MDRFSIVVLERTIELVAEALPPDRDSRIADSINIIKRYVEEPDSGRERDLRGAVKRLSDIARENHQFLIAARLSSISTQLDERSRKSDVA